MGKQGQIAVSKAKRRAKKRWLRQVEAGDDVPLARYKWQAKA